MIPTDWLIEQITRDEAEARHANEHGVFGGLTDEWRAMLADLRDGDAIWTFCSDRRSWINLAGRMGVALVRAGRVVDLIVTRRN